MKENLCYVSAPFDIEQVKSINKYQRDRRFHPLTCNCGGMFYAKEDGLTCKKCLFIQEFVPTFCSNYFWNKFKYPVKQEENGVD